MTQLKNISVEFPAPLHAVPHQGGMFDHLPKVKDLGKVFAKLGKPSSNEEVIKHQGELAGYLKRMGSTYHSNLPELLSICHSHASLMSDANLERTIHVCEVALHGHRTIEERPNPAVLMEISLHALALLILRIRHKLAGYEAAFVDLHVRFFHFAHAALACRQMLGDKVAKTMQEKSTEAIALYLLLERLDLFSMPVAMQRKLIRAISPIMSQCSVYFIPAGKELDKIEGFWIDQEDRHMPGRSQLHGSLAGISTNDRLAANIMPLIRKIEVSGGGLLQSGLSDEIRTLVRKKIRSLKRREKHQLLNERARLLTRWSDIVDLPVERGSPILLLEADRLGFRLMIEDHEGSTPEVDSFIAIDHSGKVRRGAVTWKRIESKGVFIGGVWMADSFRQVQLSMLGYSELAAGSRQWYALVRRIDEKHMACWIGEPDLQPGISILLPVGEKKYSSILERVEHRGGNYCYGVLTIGEEWQELGFELDQ